VSMMTKRINDLRAALKEALDGWSAALADDVRRRPWDITEHAFDRIHELERQVVPDTGSVVITDDELRVIALEADALECSPAERLEWAAGKLMERASVLLKQGATP